MAYGLGKIHFTESQKILESAELERTHQHNQVKFLALPQTPQESYLVPESFVQMGENISSTQEVFPVQLVKL